MFKLQTKKDEKQGIENENDDVGPTPDSTVTEEKDVFVLTGYVDNGGKSHLSPDDKEINDDLQNAVDSSSNITSTILFFALSLQFVDCSGGGQSDPPLKGEMSFGCGKRVTDGL